MPSVWIARRARKHGGTRYRVMYRLGGREAAPRYGGAFSTRREALIRKAWIAGELAAMRAPDLRVLVERPPAPTLAEVAQRWHEAQIDVAESTRNGYHRSAIAHIVRELGRRRVDELQAADVADFIAKLAARGLKRETIRKARGVLAMILDHAGLAPNPARDRVKVKLPREEAVEPQPPTRDHIEAVFDLLPTRYRLPLLVLDATGMRLGELEQLTWGDVDELRSRWRIRKAASKTGLARWVQVPPVVFAAVLELVPRDDRTPERRVFQGFGGDRFRTQIARSCVAAGVPTFSPHDLRHRRISLLHLAGVPWARIGEHVGQRNLAVTANTYSHVLLDEAELDYENLIERARVVQTPVQTSAAGKGD
jgi:integrase